MLRNERNRRWLTAGALAAVALAVGAVFGGAGKVRASRAAPTNQTPPTVSGTPEVGLTLTSSRLLERHDAVHVRVPVAAVRQHRWQLLVDQRRARKYVRAQDRRCRQHDSLARYREERAGLGPVDVGSDRRHQAGPQPTTNGCPTSGTGTLDIKDATPPARLLIDGQQISPSVVTRSTQDLTVRFHVTACGGRPVQGALLYATAVPFSQFTIPPEATTGSDGWASLTMHQDRFFPASSRQQLLRDAGSGP